jgi:class 3 adenylate cyclase
VICAACGTENEAGRKFCSECGTRLAISCAACGSANAPTARFCGECGNPLAEAPISGVTPASHPVSASATAGAGALGELSPSVAERRLVTVVFNDLVGFTALSESRDAEDTREMLSRYFEAARDIVERHGGVIEKFIGDAVMAVWGTPTAHEDDAERAVRTALELVAAVGAMDAGGQHLQARAGVLTGEAAVNIGATNQGMVAGDLVNTASRLQSVAQPGTVLVGESTYRAAGRAIAFEPAGEQQLKGKIEPVPTWRAVAVVARRGGQGRSATLEPPFVGRSEELHLLKELFHATAREGKPRLVTMVGQAGIGKSRLGWELEKYLDGVVEQVYWHEGRSPAYGEGISYWALAEIVRGRAGIAESDPPDESRARLAAMLAEFVPDASERKWVEPRFAALLALEDLPAEGREQLFAAWRTFFERMAERATVILVFRDIQWADQGLLDFIEHLLTWARTSPIYVLAEARPELVDRRAGWGSGVRSATSVKLEPLLPGEMRELLAGLVPGLPSQAVEAIVDRADGVPLYAVETLRMLIDRDVLREEGDHYALAGELPELTVPETLHALVAARLDAIAPADRAVATTAAVLGVSFTFPAVQALAGQEGDALEACLERLIGHQLLLLEADPRSPERGQYKFVQGVIREVAYQSLSKRDRRAKHLAAARYFESLGEDELAGVLASHYLDAWRASAEGPEADALAAQARVALRAAADRAATLHSPMGAVGYLEQALEVTTDPAEQAQLHERAARGAVSAAQHTLAMGHAQAAEVIYASTEDRLGVLRARTLQAWVHLAQHADRAAISLLERALAEVADLPPSAEIAGAWAEVARALMIGGSDEAVVWADRVLANPDLVDDATLTMTLITKGTQHLHMRRELEGEVILWGAIARADREGDVMAGLRARNNILGTVDGNDLRASLALIRESYEIANRYGQQIFILGQLGTALDASLALGDWEAWLTEMRDEAPDPSSFYGIWLRIEEALRRAYRGEAEAVVAELQAMVGMEAARESAQASAGIATAIAEGLIAAARYLEAGASARAALGRTDQADDAIRSCLFAAAGAGDPSLIREAAAALPAPRTREMRSTRAARQMADALAALLEDRWDEARGAYLAARRTLEEWGAATDLARLELAVGHRAEGRFREADEALREAEAFFHERGADAYVASWRANAARSAAPSAGSAQSAASMKRAGSTPATSADG